jgi:hypothetical protein
MNRLPLLLLFSLLTLSVASCNFGQSKEKLKKTTVRFKDSVRHYFALPQGKQQYAHFKFYNTGKNPLAILEVQTSCGCAVPEFPDRLIEPEGEGVISIQFDSYKYLGYSKIYVTVRANTEPAFHTLIFDLNVVPDAHYTKDYEEVYKEREEKEGRSNVKEMVEGDETQAGYYLDDSTEATTY